MRKHVATSNTDDFELRYYETKGQCENGGAVFYGIFVEKYINGNLVEEMESGPIAEDSSQILEIMSKLSENSVTPFALCEILDEMEMFS